MGKFVTKDRTGETRMMSNGLMATVVRYVSTYEIDVLFENGILAEQVYYSNFAKGKIKTPMKYEQIYNYIKCTNIDANFEFLIDIEDLWILGDTFWWGNDSGYAMGWINGKNVRLHRLIMDCPLNMQVDHINGNRADNRKYNLRVCTKADNNKNITKKKNSLNKYKGVKTDKRRGTYIARICSNGITYYSKSFKSEIEAALKYNEMAINHHGEYAKLNEV